MSKKPVLRPTRSTAIRSVTARTSSISGLTSSTPRCWSRSRCTSSSTRAAWRGPSAAVGSSRMISSGSPISARAMATPCRWAPDSDATGTRRLPMDTDSASSRLRARFSILISLSMPRVRNSRPRKRFSTVSRLSHSAWSWWMVAMPSFMASCGRRRSTARPRHSTTPASGCVTPAMTLTSVDLPAPLLPTSPTASPSLTVRLTSRSACTAPKRLETPCTASSGVLFTPTTSSPPDDPPPVTESARRTAPTHRAAPAHCCEPRIATAP